VQPTAAATGGGSGLRDDRGVLFCASSARYGQTPEGVRNWAGPIGHALFILFL
jgi:hypothetical protein